MTLNHAPKAENELRDQDRFLIRQRVRLVGNQYEVYLPAPDGKSEGDLVAFVQQKLAALKEDIRFYGDADKQQELFRLKARQAFDPTASYRVTDPEGNLVGELSKDFKASLAQSKWHLRMSGGASAWARERSLPVALLRRTIGLIGLVPLLGALFDAVANLIPIPYHFDFYIGDRRIGGLERRYGLRDRYVLDLAGDVERSIDRRVALALAVSLDALQAR
jgi:uncharacterized protein YxjI